MRAETRQAKKTAVAHEKALSAAMFAPVTTGGAREANAAPVLLPPAAVPFIGSASLFRGPEKINARQVLTLAALALLLGASVAEARLGPTLGAHAGRSLLQPQPTAPARDGSDTTIKLRADTEVWTTTYFPKAGDLAHPDGDPRRNLWAKNGPLDKFDKYLAELGRPTGARKFELEPALNWLINKPSGHFIPASTLNESDAERTTGVDFNGNGRIDPDVKWDFLDGSIRFGKNKKTDDVMDVSWWGECNNVALAGGSTKVPIYDVRRGNETFTPQDIKGLLTLIAESQSRRFDWALDRYDAEYDVVSLMNGKSLTGTIEGVTSKDFLLGNSFRVGDRVYRLDYNKPFNITLSGGAGRREVSVAEFADISRETPLDPPAEFHETLLRWLGDKRPLMMDHDSGEHVWNENYNGADVFGSSRVPEGIVPAELIGVNGAYKGGDLRFFDTRVLRNGDTSQLYSYWLESKDGQSVNSGWLPFSGNPDFMFRPVNAEFSFTGYNARNPFVDPVEVGKLYRESIKPPPPPSPSPAASPSPAPSPSPSNASAPVASNVTHNASAPSVG